MTSTALKVITWNELMQHASNRDCWVLIDGKIYDVTTYLAEHPGGDDILLKNGGKDATQNFKEVNHTDYAVSLRDQRIVGEIEKNPQPEEYKKWASQVKQLTTKYTWEEVRRHNKKGDTWVVMEGKVYDLSQYLDKHPGGPSVILGKAGRDATQAFEKAKHPTFAIKEKENYQIGFVDGVDTKPVGDSSSSNGLLSPVNLVLVLVVAAIAYYLLGQN